MSSIRYFLPFMLGLLLLPRITHAQQENLRICTWNLLRYDDSVPLERQQAFLEVVASIRPDILVVQNLVGEVGHNHFGTEVMSVLSSKQWFSGGFIDGPGNDNGLFYDPTFLELISHDTLEGAGHAVDRWVMRYKRSGDTIHIFGTDLYGGNTEEDRGQRNSEAGRIRMTTTNLSYEHNYFLTAGTLNAYASNDPGYTPLTYIGGLAGEMADPLHSPGDWSDNQEFAYMHTSSSRLREFDGGTGGGLKDRFDFILASYTLMQHYREGSYTAYGNDGGHFRDSVNKLPSEGYSQQILTALHTASDHLPVYADFMITAPASGVQEEKERMEKMDLSEVKGK